MGREKNTFVVLRENCEAIRKVRAIDGILVCEF